MTWKRFGRAVSLVTDKATSESFAIGLEAVQSGRGTLVAEPQTDYSGDGIRFQKGDVLFGKLRPYLAKAWHADRHGAAVGDFHVYRPNNGVYGNYVKYVLLSRAFLEPVTASVTGAKMPRVDAVKREDTAEVEALDQFRKDVATFVRLYDFMSQVVDYGDTQLEKRSIFLRLLERYIRTTTITAEIDLSDVVLTKIRHSKNEKIDISLGDGTGLRGVVAAGSGATPDPVMVAFQAVIDRLNDLFGTEFSRSQVEGFVDTLGAVLLEDEELVDQARVNSRAQFLESPDLSDAVVDAVFANQSSHNAIADYIASGHADADKVISEIGAMIHAAVAATSQVGR